ncbi:hypothetical protein AB986_04880 [Alkalihalobacillus macyae]|uniref:Uncharacterized protein n=2 Tax=Guptibacillus hwajinpoensis TaxID=208199 RepID=A0A0J6CZY2_9BACL|nr:hypothetical protein AB986_04880 [Alkalihalobacillus macyae]
MFGQAELSGCIQLKTFCNEIDANCWLQENPDLEVVDIKFSATEADDCILLIYRIEEQGLSVNKK